MNRTTVFVTDSQQERLRMLAQRDGISVSEEIRQAIEVYLALRERDAESPEKK